MSEEFFTEVPSPIRFGGLDSDDPLAFKVYDARPDRAGQADGGPPPPGRLLLALVRLAGHGHVRHRARSTGRGSTRRRDEMDGRARTRWPPRSSSSPSSACRTTASTTATSPPRATTFAEFRANLDALADDAAGYQERTGVRLLWGTANLFTHPRYQAGAATNPDPEVFAYAAAQVKHMLEVTQRLGGENYVLWGGREGYDTLLNTDLRREGDAARAVPAPGRGAQAQDRLHGPAAHRAQADGADQAPVRLRRRRPSTASWSATASRASTGSTSRRTTPRWPATASTTRSPTRSPNGILGSIDANRGDPQNGWDTDQFPNSVEDLALPLYEILRGGGLAPGRLQLRRQAAPPEHRPQRPVPRPHRRARHAGPGAAGGGRPDRARRAGGASATERYAGWDGELGHGDPRRLAEPRRPRGPRRRRERRSDAGSRAARSGSRTWSTSASGQSDR